MATKPDLSTKQKLEHGHVLSVAKQNLELVINQVESLDHQSYDELLEALDNTKTVMERAYGKTQKTTSQSQT